MKKFLLFSLVLGAFVLYSCHKDEPFYSPVDFDLSQVPYPKLSDYKFFEGELKNQTPVAKVIPYKPASSLFSDYAHKKRFVWLPKGTRATYNGDDNVFNFPIGAVLIKTFYYDNVQPSNTTRLVETRLLINKTDGWKAFTYVWNEAQTDAFLEATGNGIFVPITFINGGVTKNINYKVPSQTECVTCHKINLNHITNGEIAIPIGPKPQNLNTTYDYNGTVINQLDKWRSEGYIGNDVPNGIYSTVDWEDTTQPLELRARSYLDMNCGHCHREGGHCDYTNVRFNFSNTNPSTLGVCMTPLFSIPNMSYVINKGRANRSELVYRISSVTPSEMMPIVGRSVVHDEGVQLIKDWINGLSGTCQ